jgi:hypothetical protein
MIDPITMTVLSALAPPAYAMVCSVPTAPLQDAAKASDRVDEIIETHEKNYQEFVRRYQEAETDEARQAVLAEGIPSPNKYFEELEKIAKANRGSEAAGKAAAWVLQNNRGGRPGMPNPGEWALDMLLADFIETEHIADVPMQLSGLTTKNVEALERIREHAKDKRARALADYTRGSQLLTMSNAAKEIAEPGSSGDPYMQYSMQGMDDDMRKYLAKEGMADECLKSGEELLEHCIKAYKDVELYPGYEMYIGAKAEGELFELRHLQIGMVAPDITGEDAEGVAFNLSDYRGQVILLDFWGFW